MKVMTVLGTRPEIIRLSLLISKLDSSCEHVLVNTGQNFDPNLSEIFFRELGVRAPDEQLGVRGNSPGEIMAQVLERCERVLQAHKPDRLLILGDKGDPVAPEAACVHFAQGVTDSTVRMVYNEGRHHPIGKDALERYAVPFLRDQPVPAAFPPFPEPETPNRLRELFSAMRRVLARRLRGS